MTDNQLKDKEAWKNKINFIEFSQWDLVQLHPVFDSYHPEGPKMAPSKNLVLLANAAHNMYHLCSFEMEDEVLTLRNKDIHYLFSVIRIFFEDVMTDDQKGPIESQSTFIEMCNPSVLEARISFNKEIGGLYASLMEVMMKVRMQLS